MTQLLWMWLSLLRRMRRLGFFPAAWGYFRVGSVGRRAVKGASLLYLGFGKACFAALLGFGIYFVGVRL